MVEPGIGLSLFNEMEARFWLSGYTHSENRWRVSLVPASGEPFLVIRALDAAALRDRSSPSDIATFRDWCGNGAMVRPVTPPAPPLASPCPSCQLLCWVLRLCPSRQRGTARRKGRQRTCPT